MCLFFSLPTHVHEKDDVAAARARARMGVEGNVSVRRERRRSPELNVCSLRYLRTTALSGRSGQLAELRFINEGMR